MARKKKSETNVIVIDRRFKDSEFKPKCYGCKKEYCRQELCGDWYYSCEGCEDEDTD